jgi:hypothetical protein
MIKLEFNIDKFNDSIKNIKQEKVLTDVEIKAHELISIISDYIDCEAATIMNLTDETLDKAIDMVTNDPILLHSMAATSKMNGLARSTKTQKKALQADLF